MNLLLAGATGLIGQAVVAQWAGPGTLHLLVRRALPLPGAHGKLHVVDFSALPALPAADAALCALGTTIKTAGSQAAFRAVDFDAVLAFAQAAKTAGVQRFAVVSALGASACSSNFYSRVKGEMEAALCAQGFETLIIARPSLLTGNREALGQPRRRIEHLAMQLSAPLAALVPAAWRPIAAETVARALLQALAQRQPGVRILDNAALHQQGAPR
jgi:uncharacterized protein YbjT (DUF2867 family)